MYCLINVLFASAFRTNQMKIRPVSHILCVDRNLWYLFSAFYGVGSRKLTSRPFNGHTCIASQVESSD